MSQRYLIAGDGRLALHLKYYLEGMGLLCSTWTRKLEAKNQGLAAELLNESDTVLLMISDDAIPATAKAWRELSKSRSGKRFVHFSGSLSLAEATGFHPLMTFGQTLYDFESYTKIPFVCDADGISFSEIFPTLSNPNFKIPRDSKAYYHSLCVLSGNFSALLWNKFFSELENRFDIPKAVAQVYLNRINANIGADHKQALTGPLQRGDMATLDRDFKALAGDPFQSIFKSFVESFQKGNLDS